MPATYGWEIKRNSCGTSCGGTAPLFFCGGDECASKEFAVFWTAGAAAALCRRGRATLIRNRQLSREFDPTKGYAGQDILPCLSSPTKPHLLQNVSPYAFASNCSSCYFVCCSPRSSNAAGICSLTLLWCCPASTSPTKMQIQTRKQYWLAPSSLPSECFLASTLLTWLFFDLWSPQFSGFRGLICYP